MTERVEAPLAPAILDVGCGMDKLAGAIGIDANPRSRADVVHDLDVFPWPFADDTFEYVRAQDVLEHVVDFVRCMEEIWRVCKDGAIVTVRMPFMTSVHFATDPTHRRSSTSRTFDYFDPKKPLGGYSYSTASFEVLSFHYERGYEPTFVGSVLEAIDEGLGFVRFLERRAAEYEHYFAGVYPMHNVVHELRVLKAKA